ncbi:hypothetical protein MASSI9I_20268 [Massilia sp. 9I]|nr:hypothetical protein MASSI9I_20268 [Massilia sp. 9I]
MRISSDAPTGRRWWRIFEITGGATSSARDRAASFFRRRFSIRVSSRRFGLYCRSSSDSESLFISMPTWLVMIQYPILGWTEPHAALGSRLRYFVIFYSIVQLISNLILNSNKNQTIFISTVVSSQQ